MLRAPKRSKLSDHLLIYLAREIVATRRRAGDLLPAEIELAARFGISKPVARESLQALAAAGMVRVQQGKRTIVLGKGEWNVLIPTIQQAYWLEGRAPELIWQLYEIRQVLETKAAVWAAERGDQEDLDKLEECIQEMRVIGQTSKDMQAFLAVDLAFHVIVATAAGNIVLSGVLRNFHSSPSNSWSRSKVTLEDLELLINQ